MPDWQTAQDYQGFALPAPYAAPEGATTATLVFMLRNNAENHLPVLFPG